MCLNNNLNNILFTYVIKHDHINIILKSGLLYNIFIKEKYAVVELYNIKIKNIDLTQLKANLELNINFINRTFYTYPLINPPAIDDNQKIDYIKNFYVFNIAVVDYNLLHLLTLQPALEKTKYEEPQKYKLNLETILKTSGVIDYQISYCSLTETNNLSIPQEIFFSIGIYFLCPVKSQKYIYHICSIKPETNIYIKNLFLELGRYDIEMALIISNALNDLQESVHNYYSLSFIYKDKINEDK